MISLDAKHFVGFLSIPFFDWFLEIIVMFFMGLTPADPRYTITLSAVVRFFVAEDDDEMKCSDYPSEYSLIVDLYPVWRFWGDICGIIELFNDGGWICGHKGFTSVEVIVVKLYNQGEKV